jgi:hypothetical protein
MLISPRRGKSIFFIFIFRLFVVAKSNRHAFLIFSFCHEGKEKSSKRYGKRVSIRQTFPQRRKRKTNKRLAARFIYRLERESAGNPKRQCNPTRRIYTHKHVHTHTHTSSPREQSRERETGQTQTAAFAVAATCKLLTTLL